VGAPATIGERERDGERKLENRDYIWIYWHVSSEELGTGVLKEGAGGAVGDRIRGLTYLGFPAACHIFQNVERERERGRARK
jgi:hypothetical protein